MYKQGHYGLNSLLYAPVLAIVASTFEVGLGVIGAVAFIGVSSIPDIDRHFDQNMGTNDGRHSNQQMNQEKSSIWHLVPIKHRGFTHTVWFAMLIGIITTGIVVAMSEAYIGGAAPDWFVLLFGFFCGFGGVIGHIFGDAMTKAGVKPFSPISSREYSLRLFNSSSSVVNYTVLVIGGMVLLITLGWSITEQDLVIESGMIIRSIGSVL